MFKGLSSLSCNLIPIRCEACGELSSAMRSLSSYVGFFLAFAAVFLAVFVALFDLLASPALGAIPVAVAAATIAILIMLPLWALLTLQQEEPGPDVDPATLPGDISAGRKVWWLAIGLGIALLVIGAGVAAYEFSRIARRPPASTESQSVTALPSAALAWRHRTLAGEDVEFAALASGVVFVNVWATWCGPCVAELPSIARLRTSLASHDIAFVVVSTESPDTVREFAADMEADLPLVTTDELPEAFRTPAIPATFVVRNGQIVYRHVGAADWSNEEFRAWLIAQL